MAHPNSYNQIAKATGIFGGVQIINVLLGIIRSKFVAVLLGTVGLGIVGLFTATTSTIAAIANLGISFSAVRTISAAAGTNNRTLISRTIITLRRWVNFTGIAGAIITLVLAPQLSQWTFGNHSYTWAFVWLSLTLFFQEVSSGQLALLQGLRKIKQLAKANVLGSFLGLCLSLPLYYWLGIRGIVPALILTAGTSLVLSWYFTRQVEVEKVAISAKESFIAGLDMVKLGSVMMIAGFATTGTSYLIRMYISRTGGIEQVGLYTAAGAIVSYYVSMVFTAMGTDYFPRLSAVNDDNVQVTQLANQQAEIAILLLGPILILMLSALPLVIKILLTPKFMPVIAMLQWAIIGVLFKAVLWSIGFIMLAKGDGRTYFLSEIASNVFILAGTVIFYNSYKLEGAGFGYLLGYLLSLILVFFLVHIKYGFSFSPPFIKLFLIQLTFATATLVVVWRFGFPKAYFSGAILFALSALYSYREAKKRIDLRALWSRIKKRRGKSAA